jgi:hypothetical protein
VDRTTEGSGCASVEGLEAGRTKRGGRVTMSQSAKGRLAGGSRLQRDRSRLQM